MSAFEVRSNVRAVSDWRAHAVEFRASGLASFYASSPPRTTAPTPLEARGRLDLTKRTNIEVLVSHQLDKDTRSAARRTERRRRARRHRDGPRRRRPQPPVQPAEPAAQRLRLPTSTSRRWPSIGGGIIRQRRARHHSARGRVPRELGAQPQDGRVRRDGRQRPRVPGRARRRHPALLARRALSRRHTLRAVGCALRGEVSAGWGRQRPNDGRLGEIEGVIVDANLAWRATALTTFLLTARSNFIDTTAIGSAGALSRQVGLEARHAFRRHLIGLAGIRVRLAPYESIVLNERELDRRARPRLLPRPRHHPLRPRPAHRLRVRRRRPATMSPTSCACGLRVRQ